MTKPKLEPAPAYENAHLVATDLVQRLGELLADMAPPDEHRTWMEVTQLVEVNGLLASAIDQLECW